MFSHLSRIQQDLFHELKKVSTDRQFNMSLGVRHKISFSLNPSFIHFLYCLYSPVIPTPATEWDVSLSVCGPGLFC